VSHKLNQASSRYHSGSTPSGSVNFGGVSPGGAPPGAIHIGPSRDRPFDSHIVCPATPPGIRREGNGGPICLSRHYILQSLIEGQFGNKAIWWLAKGTTGAKVTLYGHKRRYAQRGAHATWQRLNGTRRRGVFQESR
jgi:hypothetical protein